ncbi:MAG: amidohydrolase family protein, partial [Bacteroidia bacterium]|nr:amidohydrolase family protein [Bacteroidia bacterium]
MYKPIYLIALFLCSSLLFAQDYFPKNDGVSNQNTNYTVFTNAKIHITPTEVIKNGMLLIKDGKVISSGKQISIPENTIEIDLNGKSIYPSFIELYSDFGIAKPQRQKSSSNRPQYDATREGFYWNDHIRPEQNGIDYFSFDEKSASSLRKAGFGLVNTHLQDGIIRGTGVLVLLSKNEKNSKRIVNSRSAQYTSFSKSVKSRQSYPTSIMGSFALLRQVSYDAEWYANGHATNVDRSLEAYNKNKSLVQIIEAGSRLNASRADKVGDEIGVNYVILGGGDEYERIKDIKNTNTSYIIPVKFPNAYDVENPFLASYLDLETMREWNQKPSNLKVLSENNIEFAITTKGLKTPTSLKSNLIKAISYGFDKDKALAALTTVPAKIIEQSDKVGSLKNGRIANFLITSGHPLDKGTVIYQNWINGKNHEFESINIKDIKGTYTFKAENTDYNLTISGSPSKPITTLKSGDHKIGSKISYKDNWVNLTFKSKDSIKKEFFRIVANPNNQGNLSGKVILPNGNEQPIVLAKSNTDSKAKKTESKNKTELIKPVQVTFPNNGYGFKSLPKQETILFKNATVWTNEDEGILENTDVLIKDGKIAKIGKNLSNGNAKVIDATGKHLTSGIIDEHSHIATSSVNESGQNSTAEVSIEDVINPEDIKIYRNLAGGVTSIQVLHGSANPVGGRSAIIKLK